MSEKSLRMGQRRRRYLARLRGEKKGVSPVVATLILILIAVAAAAALYLWLVVWQGNITGGIGSPHAQAILTLGGSTSAYPFTSAAASWFEQNNSDVTVSDNQGGTTAGLLAACAGEVDIGVSSSPQTVTTLETTYGCPSQYANSIQITTIAYDAVDVAIPSANSMGLYSINYDTLTYIYDQYSTTTPTLVSHSINNAEISAAVTAGAPTWGELPSCVAAISCGTSAAPETGAGTTAAPALAASAETITSSAACNFVGPYTGTVVVPDSDTQYSTGYAGISPQASNFQAFVEATGSGFSLAPTLGLAACTTTTPTLGAVTITGVTEGSGSDTYTFSQAVTTPGAPGTNSVTAGAAVLTYPSVTATGCGWTQCASGTAKIVPVERSDGSGTTQTFEAKLLGAVSNKAFATSFSALGYTGCGSNNLLSDCGINVATQETGDPALIREVSSTPNAIGYASDGLVRTSGSGVTFIAVDAPGQAGNLTVTSGSTVGSGAVLPTTGSTGTIAAGITDSSTVNQYSGWRPFQFVALEPYTGVAQEFVTFIMDPANNQALASATFEVSVYSV